MVNEHRPYLPMALFSFVWLVPGFDYLLRKVKARRFHSGAAVATFGLLVASLFSLTFARNRVFQTTDAYYRDLVKKAPSGRAHVNYGLALTRMGRHAEAMEHYKRALRLEPGWHIVHINIGVAYQRQGNHAAAAHHFNRAVATERYGGLSLQYRGYFRLLRKSYRPALADFRRALRLCVDCFRALRGMATAHAGLGDAGRALAFVKKLLRLDGRRAETVIASISAPFWQGGAANHRAGMVFYQGVDRLLPKRWWVKQNLADLARRLGLHAEAQRYRKAAARLRPRK
jgi:tetratricopeptide (TPR) repeat protein